MDELELINPDSLQFVEALYESYLNNDEALPSHWREYFTRTADGNGAGLPEEFRSMPRFQPSSIFNPRPLNGAHGNGAGYAAPMTNGAAATAVAPSPDLAIRQHLVGAMARAYRDWGHRAATLDPLGREREAVPELDPAHYGFTAGDMETDYVVARGHGQVRMKLGRIIQMLRNTYCRSIGVQFTHIEDNAMKLWLEERMESTENRLDLSPDDQFRILTLLTDAAVLEDFIDKKYKNSKRFSLEGAESMIPLLQLALNKAAQQRQKGIVIGMAHRGRLNVLAHIIGLSPREIFREFEGTNPDYAHRSGDVKYHLGHSSIWTGPNGWNVHLSLCFNPSHLEYVNPIVMGRVRSIQDRHGDFARAERFGIQIHGDAAFAGEGIVQECLNMSRLRGYDCGGTLHLIVNNQLGFTTNPEDGRSTPYASDVALMLQVPIFHVNGEDPEAVAQVVELAMEFRQNFHRDVVIDMYCYRKYGHNEADEPSFTQPLMYREIRQRPSVRDKYLEQLTQLGSFTREQAEAIANEARAKLDSDLATVRSDKIEEGAYCNIARPLGGIWDLYRGGPEAMAPEVPTAVERDTLDRLFQRLNHVPEGFELHPRLAHDPKFGRGLMDTRAKMAGGELPLDWGAAENLAYATLLTSGHRLRMSGQDCERGTFSHRMAVLHDYNTDRTFMPLANLDSGQAQVEIYNSPLSEEGVMGFEFGYSLDCPEGLIVWEAQFGDFANAGQVIIDQFLAASEAKWAYLSGLTLLLPHGQQGIGPEHASARLERFLTLAAEDNMQIAQPTTPAQMFHLLRRQVLRPWRKPLVIMTPKQHLRYAQNEPFHLQATSTLGELASGSFQRILPDFCPQRDRAVEMVVLCSGKVYFDLAKLREDLERWDVAILRVEQLYPLGDETLASALSLYPDGMKLRWVQEEPENMGALRYMLRRLAVPKFSRFEIQSVSRPGAASPATGSEKVHKASQAELLTRAFVI
jgi:2-oxoglutarate dehydrogenase E1 component